MPKHELTALGNFFSYITQVLLDTDQNITVNAMSSAKEPKNLDKQEAIVSTI